MATRALSIVLKCHHLPRDVAFPLKTPDMALLLHSAATDLVLITIGN